MTNTLFKNFISFILTCVIIVSLGVVFLAATSSYTDSVMGAVLRAEEHFLGDIAYAKTSDIIDTHTCSQDGDASDYSTILRVHLRCEYEDGGEDLVFIDTVREDDTNLVEIEFKPGFGNDLKYATSEHRAQLTCEGVSSYKYLTAIPD